ncbi:ABC transporter ATP-binding protein [Paenibacillus antri]|uniref:ABC transporter ATP-binding protein n=1 Tax=Paenibacillus antri TaxID=2582848 RepID=A0A5R9GCG2_9BACL|nr:ABC transporter ATP-binding protein [Paenibacillus antri]TLS52016.1 ABC transporter ATP-binding protein [Paenibacillus antri]
MMNEELLVQAHNVSKKYKIYKNPYHRLIEWATFGTLGKHEQFWALQDISFELHKGECLGIIGHNGAGKSTLLKILSKALWPTTGEIKVSGNMVSLLELGTGFHPELSGLDNIYNSGKLLGFDKHYLNEKIDDILNFAELGDFIKQPVKTYSSGMFVRLAFSLFANLKPDIYIVDEALSVGDIFFQQKCFSFLKDLKEKGTGIILVTHDMQTVMKFCDKVLIFDKGRIVHSGSPVDMVNLFYSMGKTGERSVANEVTILDGDVQEKVSIPLQAKLNISQATGIRRGDKKVELLGVEIVSLDQQEINTAMTGDKLRLNIYAVAHEDVEDLTFGYQITDRHNTVVFGQNSYMVNQLRLRATKNQIMKATFDIDMRLFQGLYTFAIAATDCDTDITNHVYDWIEGAILLEIMRPVRREFHGIAQLDTHFNITYAEESSLIKPAAN